MTGKTGVARRLRLRIPLFRVHPAGGDFRIPDVA
jgi:hypothetical protein